MEPTNQIPECEETKCEETKCEETKCEETKCEERRQVVIATYAAPRSTYVVPKGFDLENKEQVKDYWVKYGTLYIKLTNEKVLKVEALHGIEDPDYKYPEETHIEDSDDLGWFDAEEYEEPPLQYDSDSD